LRKELEQVAAEVEGFRSEQARQLAEDLGKYQTIEQAEKDKITMANQFDLIIGSFKDHITEETDKKLSGLKEELREEVDKEV
jgi:hypothetical protein